MKIVTATPANAHLIIQNVEPGTIVKFQEGVYTNPLQIEGKAGTSRAPIILRGTPGVVFDGGVTSEEYEPIATELSWANSPPRYPGLYDDASDAFIKIYNSNNIIIEGITFRRFWPTIIYFCNSTNLHFNQLNMTDGTFAIYGEGDDSKSILVENCHWLQDVTQKRLWFYEGWMALHGDDPNVNGARAFDGAFFRTRNIAGEVTIRHNNVLHAANGVHMFNREKDKDKKRVGLNNNVQIYNNYFGYIRDNAIEPERRAINWWIHGNRIENCHKAFSFSLDTAGYFYIFGNTIWSNSMPGVGYESTGGALFKMNKKYECSSGPFYVFNNSFFLRCCYIKKGKVKDFLHCNNAIAFCDSEDEENMRFCENKSFFGSSESGFTSDWESLNIQFDNDLYWHHGFPFEPKYAKYGVTNPTVDDPLFISPKQGNMRIHDGSRAKNGGRLVTISLPAGGSWTSPEGCDIGAFQGDEMFVGPKFELYDEAL